MWIDLIPDKIQILIKMSFWNIKNVFFLLWIKYQVLFVNQLWCKNSKAFVTVQLKYTRQVFKFFAFNLFGRKRGLNWFPVQVSFTKAVKAINSLKAQNGYPQLSDDNTVHVQYCEIMRFTVLHNRHHKVSQSVPFFMHCKTVTIFVKD